MTITLDDLQLVLLSTASQRKTGNLFPVASSIAGQEERIEKAANTLLRHALIEEVEVRRANQRWRTGDDRPIGLIVTDQGRHALGIGELAKSSDEKPFQNPQSQKSKSGKPTKRDQVVALLKAEGGATLDDLINATGWLPHTTRAALTGLRKQGFAIERTKTDGVSRYAIGIAK